MKKGYINTKENNDHYCGKVWITKGDRPGKNICVDMGAEELRVIAFVPDVTIEIVKKSIKAMGWSVEDWLK